MTTTHRKHIDKLTTRLFAVAIDLSIQREIDKAVPGSVPRPAFRSAIPPIEEHEVKLLRKLEGDLDKLGVEWEIIRKRRHYVIIIAGRKVGIFPGGTGSEAGRSYSNVLAQIRRAAREAS